MNSKKGKTITKSAVGLCKKGVNRFYHNKVQFLQICKYRIRIHGFPKVFQRFSEGFPEVFRRKTYKNFVFVRKLTKTTFETKKA